MATAAVDHRMGPHAGTGARRVRRSMTSYVMLLPFLALFAGFLIWPLLNSLYLSLTTFNGVKPPEFVGLANFLRLFQDERFLHALSNTLVYVLTAVVLTTAFALVLALAFRGQGWGDRIMRTVFFLPSVTSTIALFLMWRWIFAAEDYGLANTVIGWLGGDPVAWLATPSLTIPIMVLMAAWSGMGYAMVIFVAGINTIPEEYYEAAKLDGATTWQQFTGVTLPLLRPVTTYVVVTTMISAFQVFEAVYIVFRQVSNVGGVLDSGLMIVPYLYDMGFTKFQLGYASAIAWALFLIIFAISLVQLRIGRTTREL
ncbi:carbohydrate ABC transporter permease [Microtetraspora sp. AC03309]|uniref:carbohydrate ABC transporter permease n=1 Tax=Microtetraspora sp. AC03309 TaxID=2779376 RepID=UPI001E2F06B9|nr:sugar ABC transporter permease [Microtetraspora sp. AC03309]